MKINKLCTFFIQSFTHSRSDPFSRSFAAIAGHPKKNTYILARLKEERKSEKYRKINACSLC